MELKLFLPGSPGGSKKKKKKMQEHSVPGSSSDGSQATAAAEFTAVPPTLSHISKQEHR